MTCFADTSLLLSLVGTDTHSPSAKRWWRKLNGPLVTTALVIFETENRLRSMRLQKLQTKEEEDECLRNLSLMVVQRYLLVREYGSRILTAEARRLVSHFSPGIPHGTLDVLHIAAARLLKADTLATFDENQRTLAKSAGLKIVP